jgi:hypothetical protein
MPFLSPLLSVRLPASGDMWMDYKPWTNWGVSSTKAGSPQIESGVFFDVALPGKQLGKLTDAVTALITIAKELQPDAIARHPERAKAIEELLKMSSNIDLKKKELQKTIEAEALDALKRLRTADSAAFKSLVEKLHTQSEDDAASDEK